MSKIKNFQAKFFNYVQTSLTFSPTNSMFMTLIFQSVPSYRYSSVKNSLFL